MSRTLRPKKSINYLEVVSDKSPVTTHGLPTGRSSNASTSTQSTHNNGEAETTDDESEYVSSDRSDTADGEYETDSEEDGHGSKKKRRKLNPTSTAQSESFLSILGDVNDDDDDEFKFQREQNMRDRENVLRTIDVDGERLELAVTVKPSPIRAPVIPSKKKSQPARRLPKKSADDAASRKSARVATRSFIMANPNFTNDPSSNGSGHNERGKLVEEDIDLATEDDDKDFFERLEKLPDVPYNSISDFSFCEFNKFSEVVRSCQMYQEPTKIIPSRITSLDFHKSESKLLLVGGDKQGHVSLWSIGMDKGIISKAHGYNTNCVSFSKDGTKFYSTSLDGTTRVSDIELKSSKLLYKAVDEENDESHTTWHHEFGQQLLIARGDGGVKLLDLRAPHENTPLYRCHKRSVRTVQVNPENDNYFLTSSGTGTFGIFDLRQNSSKQSHIILEDLGKALTSAFYSAKGSYVLTTSNDDTIRVYDCRDHASEQLVRIPHNNHCGRWLSVFKARWQPQREDCFYVGSLMTNPRRIQAYAASGKILHEFHSPMMQTHNSVISVHPTKPIIVGGNASGKIHVYSPFSDLQNQVL